MNRCSCGLLKRASRLNRQLYSTSSDTLKKSEKLIILGSGWASYTLAKSLTGKDKNIVVVSPRNHFVFTPLLPQSTTGVLNADNIFEPIDAIKAKYYRASAYSVDFENKVVHCHFWDNDLAKFQLNYDKLVIGVGAEVNTFNIPGVNKENVFFLKEISDARSLYSRLIQNLEVASLPDISPEVRRGLLNFVVVGGGPTGVEYAGELVDFFTSELKNHFPTISPSETKVFIIEASNTILNAFDSKLVSNAIKKIRESGIQLCTGTGVKEVKSGQILLSNGETIDTQLILWCTGIGPGAFVRDLDVEKSRGRILVDGNLRVKGKQSVYALGDCAEIENYALPPTAQVSDRQARYLSKCFISDHTEKFVYKTYGKLTYVGSNYALCDTPWFKSGGLTEYIIWHFAYVASFKSVRAVFVIPYNWVRTLFFGRQLSTIK